MGYVIVFISYEWSINESSVSVIAITTVAEAFAARFVVPGPQIPLRVC